MKNQIEKFTNKPVLDRAVGTGVLLASLALATLSSPAHAADWSTTNVQLLHGSSYANDFGIDDKAKTVFTLEHANGWKYGDNFFFVDVSNPTSSNTNHYAEFSPRLSIGKITGVDTKFGFVKDVLISGTWELGDGVRAYLLGVGLALDIPHFAFADFNLYSRTSHRDFAAAQTDRGYQITLDWLLPFKIGSASCAFEGFLDYAWGEGGGSSPKEDNLITAPRLLVDVGSLYGKPNNVQVGIEYQMWRSKFGIKDVDENVPQIMVKWTF